MKPTILVVDDSDFILQLLQTIFETEGWNTRMASGGVSALAMAAAAPPDAILLDVRMPGMDGWKVLEALRRSERTRHVPVALSSTDPEDLGWTLAAARGAQAYVMKPFSPADLVRTVRGLVAIDEGCGAAC